MVELEEVKDIKPKKKKNPFKKIDGLSAKKVEEYVFQVLKENCYVSELVKTYERDGETYSESFGGYWISNLTNQSICPFGYEYSMQYLARYKINRHLEHGLGFSEEQDKWYGWSHRAIFGFGVGSVCKAGDSAFVASNKEEYIAQFKNFWGGDEEFYRDEEGGYETTLVKVVVDCTDPEEEYTPSRALGVNVITNTSFFGKQEGRESYISNHWGPYPEVWGRGEWTALTLSDAKEMARDFNKGVS